MTGAEIHNGEILQDVPGVQTEVPQPRAAVKVQDLDPEQIAAAMAKAISERQALGPATPMELVNELLQLRDAKGQKLVWTRFDLFQIFAIWSKKMQGLERILDRGGEGNAG